MRGLLQKRAVAFVTQNARVDWDFTPLRAEYRVHHRDVLAGEIATSKIVPVSKSELAQGVACLVTNDALEKLDSIEGATWLAPEKLILSSGEIADQASLSDFETIQLDPKHEKEVKYFSR